MSWPPAPASRARPSTSTSRPRKTPGRPPSTRRSWSSSRPPGTRGRRSTIAAAKVTAAVTACLEQLIAQPGRARLLLVDAASAGGAGSAAIDRATQAFARLIAGAAGDRELPAIVPLAMVGGIVSLVGGWVVEDRTADLADLTPALVEILFVPLFGSSRRARRDPPARAPPAADPARRRRAAADGRLRPRRRRRRAGRHAPRRRRSARGHRARHRPRALRRRARLRHPGARRLDRPAGRRGRAAPTSRRRSTRRWPPIARSTRR